MTAWQPAPAAARDGPARTPADIFNEQLDHCHELAKVCARKYQLLRWSLITGVIGYASFLATLIML